MTITDIDADLKDRDALLQQARHLRVSGRLPAALAVLARLEAAYPRFSRLYQERAHCHIGLGDAPAALAALHAAVRLNPTLPASWDMLEQLSRRAGDTAQATMAARHLSTLKQLPREVVMANSLLADGDLGPAERVIRDYLRRAGGNVGALHLLARIRQESGATEEAETLLEAVLANAPDYHEARLDYAMVLLQQQKHLPARQQAGHLLAYDPDNRDYLKQYAAACIGLGDYEPLIAIYDRLLAGEALSAAEIADLRLWRAAALKITGNQAEAIADYRAALEALPSHGAAWFGLANLKTWRFSDDDIVRMRAAESATTLQDMDRVYLCFALGKALEDRAEFAGSWAYYAKGNAVRRQTARYRPEVAEAALARLKSVFTAEFFAERAGWGLADPAPIFVLGLPRSGSTLIEQILASHSQVEGTQELTLIGRYAAELCGQDPECGLPLDIEALRHLSPDAARALGERFLAETRTFRRLSRPFFIDKMPNNFWHIGLIHLILPHATIIDIRREPMGCGFSNLKQLFGTINQEFSYDPLHMGRHYRAYLDLMRHWDKVLPGRVLRVHYEDVVGDIEGSVQRMMRHCGLPFEPACLAFHETRRSVRTPSSEQVRRPINREGLDQWQNFAPWLEPLKEALGGALNTYRL
ncbi:tetratricopeptide repeat-containing sulfotransferase family protein [Asticcacaulis taihuensis]|uniref:Tetratricopeptide repeat-containing protein n=1 Tax=Asticcacaulis taihuensis TaxID=260084 RepID=A0A1G4TMT1_9CAUL|nr:tetratricopeptide repeat-containing sulfotransferase family protein [Asticcacaulis taihuensis]SCW82622.1 Tetratricopeptide repeat-containing protein [Asticcacaulis taihuensis]